MPAAIRVLLADDHPVWRRGVRSLLEAEDDVRVVAEADNGVDALRFIRGGELDVAVLDMEMPALDGVAVAQAVRDEALPVRVLALSSYDDEAYVTGLLSNGAAGYLTKDKPPALIVEAVRAVARGEGRWFVQPKAKENPGAALSGREREVLHRLARGRSNAEIADELFISENTVRNHLANAYVKIGVRTAREASAWAWKNGFADLQE